MKVLWAGAVVFGLLTAPVHADTQYDRKLEKAVMDIVAGKIGDIRGGFAFDAKPVLITVPETKLPGPDPMRRTYSALDPWQDGLAPAVERRIAPEIF
jgi:hypothetical protein